MISGGKDVLRVIVSCGLLLAVLIVAASAQQPAPVESSKPASDLRPVNSDGANGQSGSSGMSERERILLERIERLERRLNEVETRINATAADGGKAAPPKAQPLQLTNVAPRQYPAQPTSTTAPQQLPTQSTQARSTQAQSTQAQSTQAQSTQAQKTRATRTPAAKSPAPYAAWEKDGVKIIPFGIVIANINYNSSAL